MDSFLVPPNFSLSFLPCPFDMFARELRSQGRRSNRNIGPPVEQPRPLRLIVPPLLHALGIKAVDTLKCVANLPPPFVNLILPSWNVSRTGINTAQCLRLHPEIFRNPAPMPMRANKKLSMEPASSRDTPHRKEAHGMYEMDRDRNRREELRRLFPGSSQTSSTHSHCTVG